jgi:regulator of cell morphogenesis and NO signaling
MPTMPVPEREGDSEGGHSPGPPRGGGLTELVQYILDRHHGFLKSELPRLDLLLMKTAAVPCERDGCVLNGLRRSFTNFKAHIELHLHKEDTVLFPAAIRMAGAGFPPDAQAPGPFGTFSNIIRSIRGEHDEIIAALEEIRKITGGYDIPEGAGEVFRLLMERFSALDADLRLHLELEDNLLFPAIEKLARKGDVP